MIKIFSKKALEFKNPESGETVAVKPLAFDTLPDWAEKDPMFGWAKKDGDLEVFTEKVIPASNPNGAEKNNVEVDTPEAGENTEDGASSAKSKSSK